ncbi:MAG: TolC family protein [Bacteroidales bacterium]|nr:TolC family protein [Bacteroidales bacterium]MDY0196897.1 TolC family protein [Tenuifilaceae bacterium]
MNIQKLTFLVLIAIGVGQLKAQNSISLKECYDKAYASTPIASEKELYNQIWQVKDKNLSKGWLPTLDANGSFVYNSSVMDLSEVMGSLPIPGIANQIKPLPHEQYKITLDINQTIYDGGAVKSARAIEKAEHIINEKQIEVDLYKLRSQINTYYFNLLLIDRQRVLFQNYLEIIGKRIASLGSAHESGMLLQSDIDVLTCEKIKIEQQIAENAIQKNSLLKILSSLIGIDIDGSVEFTIPETETEITAEMQRPELQIFDLRKEQLNATMKLADSKRRPKAFGFATAGYGNPPGSNFFKDEFAPFYMVGAGVKWNIFDWNKAKNEKQVIILQQNIIESRKVDLTDNLERLLDAKSSEIQSLESLIEADRQLIELRKRITQTAESQYKNGAITATEYLNELNSEKQTLINHEIHSINLAKARVEFYNICGKEIN